MFHKSVRGLASSNDTGGTFGIWNIFLQELERGERDQMNELLSYCYMCVVFFS